MANVTINIPGIGNVVAENAASEDTLNKILAAVQKSDKAKREDEKKASDQVKRAKEAEAKASKDNADAMKGLSAEARAAKQAEEEKRKKIVESTQQFVAGTKEMGSAAVSTAASLTLSLVGLSKQFITTYDQLAKDPIGESAKKVNMGIDMLNMGVHGASDAVAAAGHALNGIPVIGPVISGLGDAASAAAKAAADLASALLKTANDIFAAEFKKSAQQLHDYTKAGASFAGGMLEMRKIANDSGISIETLSKAALASSADLRTLGLSQGEGVKKLSDGMFAASKTIGRSGNSLRDEMLALGYTYEEQGVMMSQMMALQKAAGNQRAMSDKEIAQKTADYAKDLKVLADITGKDAKKAMEEAQKASMKADIMSQLTPEQAEKFQKAYAAMPDYAKKGFLEYVSSGGTAITDAATNIAISQNAKVGDLIKGSFDDIKNQSKTASQVQDATLSRAQEAGRAQIELNKSQGAAINMANTLGGGLQDSADMINKITASGFAPTAEEIAKSRGSATKQAEATDDVTQGYQKVTKATNDFAVQMETLASQHLDEYAKMLGEAMTKAAEAIGKAVDYISGKTGSSSPSGIEVDAGTGAVIGSTAEEKASIAEAGKKLQAKGDSDRALYDSAEFKEWQKSKGAGMLSSGIYGKYGVDAYRKEMEANKPSAAMGGILSGPVSGFDALLHGIEAVVPLPDGKTIPVQMDTSGMGSANNSIDTLAQKIDTLLNNISNPSSGAASKSASVEQLTSILEEMKNVSLEQLTKHDEMIRYLQDTRDVSERILHASF